MSYSSLLNQTVTIKVKSGTNRYGREVVGAGTDYAARFERRSRNIFKPDGSVTTIDGRVFLPNTATVSIDSELVYDGTSYRVVTISDRQGRTARHHITAEVTRWNK